MNSLLERAKARPFHIAALVIGVIAAIAFLWWLFCPQASTEQTVTTSSKIVTNAPIVPLPAQPSVAASAITATSEITPAAVPPIAANTALPSDPALAEEELDRLNDEHTRLKARKAQLAQQLEISNKLLGMKEQQLKTLETPNQ